MALIHRIIGQGLEEVSRLVTEVEPGDRSRSAAVAEHLGFTLDGLHNHHTSEDEMLWPLLLERARPSQALVERMEAQHEVVGAAISRVRALSGPWAADPARQRSAELEEALRELITPLSEHLAEEERDIVPLIARHVTQQEWERLGKAAFDKFRPAQRFTALGQMLEVATPEEAAKMLADLPAPIRLVWRLVGRRRYDRYVAAFRR
jgi:iron-sulfur cluster repair protein YtfE (RIC family)